MLKSIRRTFKLKFRDRVFVCLRNNRLPAALRRRVQPWVCCCVACWFDRTTADEAA